MTEKMQAVFVTGGGRGIGRAIALRFGLAGYPVALTYTATPDLAEGVVAEIEAAGGQAIALQLDVRDADQVTACYAAATARIGQIGIVISNAGIIGERMPFAEIPPDTVMDLLRTNIAGTLFVAQEAVRSMSTRRGGAGGVIVMLSSVAARLGGLSGLVPYAATKGAIETLTKGLANEVACEGIRVVAVAPGLTRTDMVPQAEAADIGQFVPMGRMAEPDEIADAVFYVASDRAGYVTGTTLTVSGGR